MWNRFEHDGKHAAFLQQFGISHEPFRSLGIAALLAKTAELVYGLWRQSKMSHHGHTDVDKAFCNLRDLRTAFNLYSRCAAFLNQPAGIPHRFFRAQLISQEWHVGDDQRPLDSTAHGFRVVNHHVERDGKRRVIAEYDHAH